MSSWKIGDPAMCIRAKLWRSARTGRVKPEKIPGPKLGETYVVTGMRVMVSGQLGLCFTEFPAKGRLRAWRADCFKKPQPLSETEEDRETIKALKGKCVKEDA